MDIRLDDPSNPEIAPFLSDHLAEMRRDSPPESSHALEIDELQHPSVTFWAVRERGEIIGCGALKALDAAHAEIKSMRTSPSARGRGIASALLEHMLATARSRGHRRVSLETGSMAHFEPARRLYLKHGFAYCAPFADYVEDSNSVFMTRVLES